MERAIVFFLVIAILATILYFFPRTSEGFECQSAKEQEKKLVAEATKNTEDKAINPDIAQAGIGSIEPSPAPPTDLPLAIIEQRAKGAPLPYRDPSSEPAKYIRLKGMLDNLKAFMAFQAPNLTEQCDPTIQLPLSTARADTIRLDNAISVLDRNPGMESRITNREIRGIQDNLNFLKDEIRKLENNGVISEGFADTADTEDAEVAYPATLAQIKAFDARLLVEKTRIGASGTTDTVINARIATLEKIHQDITVIINQIESGQIKPEDVPIKKSDLNDAFPILGDLTKPLPSKIVNAGLPDYLVNLFPGGLSATDKSTLNQFNGVLKNYENDLPSLIGDIVGKVLNLGNNKDDTNKRDNQLLQMNNYQTSGNQTNSASEEDSMGGYDLIPQTRNLSGYNKSAPDEPGFDWKERARVVGQRIIMRGLDPKDFGVIDDTAEVSGTFSWRGYTKMICSRLMTTTDPGLPEYCGCPPYNWNSWIP